MEKLNLFFISDSEAVLVASDPTRVFILTEPDYDWLELVHTTAKGFSAQKVSDKDVLAQLKPFVLPGVLPKKSAKAKAGR
ncbi:MAG: hypothetical protein WB711_22995 [Terriglobales bacterium]